jgi:peptidoglycan/LPS O-acetylase OafA/YrhL
MLTETRTEATGSGSPDGAQLRYRPHLDGLRSVAVYLVVAYHAGLGVFSGGFIGVDIFFVLSGFLVTKILVRDLASVGRVRGRQFYARRVRRILPAAAVTLVVTALIYSVVATPAEAIDALGGFRAAFLYVANWYFIHQSTDYFAANVETNPVLTFWSLAVEEQFYLVWPMLLGGLYLVTARAGRWRWWTVRILVIAAGLASAIAALRLGETELSRAYYGTDTRAYQLFAGAALALTPQLIHVGARWRRLAPWVSALSLAGLMALATSRFDMSPITRGVLVAALTVILLAALENARGGFAKNILSTGPFTYLGRISYGVYLWHWPVIVIVAYDRSLSPISLFAIACLLATALAALSFHLIERPIRASRTLDRYKTPIIATGLAASVVCGAFVMPAILDSESNTVIALPGTGNASGLQLLDWRVAQDDRSALPDCLGHAVQRCTVATGTGSRVLLMGDSHAWMWIPTFAEIAKQRSWTLSVASHPTCPWERHLQVLYPTRAACEERQTDWYDRVVPSLDPDLIILVHQAFDGAADGLPFVAEDGSVAYPGTPQHEPLLMNASSASLHELQRPGRELLIIEPVPDAPPGTNPLSCLSRGRAPARCAFEAPQQPTPLEQFYRTEARQPGVSSLDLDRTVCPRWPTCDAVVGDIIARRDATHLTATFARSLAPQVGAQIPD